MRKMTLAQMKKLEVGALAFLGLCMAISFRKLTQ